MRALSLLVVLALLASVTCDDPNGDDKPIDKKLSETLKKLTNFVPKLGPVSPEPGEASLEVTEGDNTVNGNSTEEEAGGTGPGEPDQDIIDGVKGEPEAEGTPQDPIDGQPSTNVKESTPVIADPSPKKLTSSEIFAQLRDVLESLSFKELQGLQKIIQNSGENPQEAFAGFVDGVYKGKVDVIDLVDGLDGKFGIVKSLVSATMFKRIEQLKKEGKWAPPTESKPNQPTLAPSKSVPPIAPQAQLSVSDLVTKLRGVFKSLSLNELKELKNSLEKSKDESQSLEAFEGFLQGLYRGSDVNILKLVESLKGHYNIVTGLLRGAIVMKQEEVLPTPEAQQPATKLSSQLEQYFITQLMAALRNSLPDELKRLHQILSTGNSKPTEIESLLEILRMSGAKKLTDSLIATARDRPMILLETVNRIFKDRADAATLATTETSKETPKTSAVNNSVNTLEGSKGQKPEEVAPEQTGERKSEEHTVPDTNPDAENPGDGDYTYLDPDFNGDIDNVRVPGFNEQLSPEEVEEADRWQEEEKDQLDFIIQPNKDDPPFKEKAHPINKMQMLGESPRGKVIQDDSSSGFGMWHFLIIFLLIAACVAVGYVCSHNRKRIREGVGSYISDSRGKRSRNYRYQPLKS